MSEHKQRLCRYCGKTITERRYNAKFCSIKCGSRYRYENSINSTNEDGKICAHEGCSNGAVSRGLCVKCYAYYRRHNLSLPPPLKKRTSGSIPKPFRYKRMPSKEEKAYIAGYFDGEGCLRLKFHHQKRYCHAIVSFGQVKDESLQYIYSVYGGTLHIQDGSSERRSQTRYILSQHFAVRQFLLDIQPYVREKREQVELVLAEYFDAPEGYDCEVLEVLNARLSDMKRRSGMDKNLQPKTLPLSVL